MDPKRLQPILDYNLSEQEAKAFKLAIIWEDLTRKMFPKEKGVAKLPQGDPRKSTLFRFCWKLSRETRGLLKFEEYQLYMRANLTMIKVKNLHLSPNVLCGDTAWIRWRIWKRLYDKKALELSGDNGENKVNVEVSPAIIKKLESTKRFIFEKSDGKPSIDKLRSFYDNKSLHLWSGTRISHLYFVLSPWIKEVAPIRLLEQEMFFDSKLFEDQINENVRIYFRQEFGHEFGDNLIDE